MRVKDLPKDIKNIIYEYWYSLYKYKKLRYDLWRRSPSYY